MGTFFELLSETAILEYKKKTDCKDFPVEGLRHELVIIELFDYILKTKSKKKVVE